MQRYTPPHPAPLPDDFDEFWASLSEAEIALHHLAVEMLGTSYFIQWTHMYTKWSKERQARLKEEEAKAATAAASGS